MILINETIIIGPGNLISEQNILLPFRVFITLTTDFNFEHANALDSDASTHSVGPCIQVQTTYIVNIHNTF